MVYSLAVIPAPASAGVNSGGNPEENLDSCYPTLFHSYGVATDSFRRNDPDITSGSDDRALRRNQHGISITIKTIFLLDGNII